MACQQPCQHGRGWAATAAPTRHRPGNPKASTASEARMPRLIQRLIVAMGEVQLSSSPLTARSHHLLLLVLAIAWLIFCWVGQPAPRGQQYQPKGPCLLEWLYPPAASRHLYHQTIPSNSHIALQHSQGGLPVSVHRSKPQVGSSHPPHCPFSSSLVSTRAAAARG